MLTTKDIINKSEYLAQVVSQPCAYDHDERFCAVKSLRKILMGCPVNEAADYLKKCEKLIPDKIENALDDHFKCAYEV